MRRRPSRHRSLSVPIVEALEPRLLLANQVSVQGSPANVTDPAPGSCEASPVVTFTLSDTGSISGGDFVDFKITSVNATFVDGSTIGNPSSPITGEIELTPGTSQSISLTQGIITAGQPASITMTLDGVDTSCNGSNGSVEFSPGSATVTVNGPAVPESCPSGPPAPQPCPFCPTGSLATTAGTATGVTNPSSLSDAGVQYGTGAVEPTAGAVNTLFVAGAPNNPGIVTGPAAAGGTLDVQTIPFISRSTGLDLGWTNLAGYDPGFGSGMDNAGLPWIEQGPDGSIVAVAGAGNGIFFDYDASTSTYSPEFYSQDTLAPDGSGGYLLTQDDGSTFDFYGFGTGVPAAQQGQPESMTDADGHLTTTTYNSSGQLTVLTSTDGTTDETYAYSYVASGVNAGLISDVALEFGPSGGALSVVQQAVFTYYDGTQAGGDAGEMEEQTIEDGSGTSLGTTYYRYYTQADLDAGAVGYVGGLEYQLDPQSYARLAANLPSGTTPETATDAQLAPYADQYYQYDDERRVTLTTVQGAGCSCSGSTGQGTYSYAYTDSSNPAGENSWAVKTVETLPDGSEDIVYTNAYGQPILSAVYDPSDSANSALDGDVWATYYRYDDAGRVILAAQPSAVAITDLSTLNTAAAGYADVVGYDASAGTYAYLNSGSGLIDLTTYGSATTATSTTPGNVAGYLESNSIQQGYDGTPILQDSTQYIAHTAGGITVYPVATSTVYRDTDGTGAETTTTAYTWYSGTDQVQSTAVSAPVVSVAEDGPGTADVTTAFYDADGRPTWTMDGDGFIDYTAYDDATGAVVESIVDVDTALTSEFTGLPSGWATPAGGGLNLITTDQVDDQGRTVEETSPDGNVTYTIYDDPDHEVRTYVGWDAATGTATGPTQVTREDWAGGYTETLTMAAAPAVSGTAGSYVPTGTEDIADVLTLSRSLLDTGGRDVEDDDYFDLAGLTYSTAAVLGTLGVNYYATYYGYDERGRQDLVEDADGTITITKFDALGRPTSVYVGTDDDGFWTGGGSSNMKLVESEQYDDDGVGDGNLTRDTQYPDSTAADARTTVYAYDWRDRLVATKTGDQLALGPEDDLTNRPIVYDDLDNLGEVVAISQFDGDDVTVSTTEPSSSLLRSYVTIAYDDQGRAYEQLQYDVDPSTGAVSTYALTTLTFYDHRGDTIAVYQPGGTVTKDQYDGAGRLVVESTTDGAGGTTWADASTVAGDHVITQTFTTYDGDGDVILTTTADRLPDAPADAVGDLDGPGLRITYTVPPVTPVIDDGGPGYTESATGWTHFTGAGYDGTEEDATAGDGSDTADWTFTGLAAGSYTVTVTYTAWGTRADNAPYSVYDGTTPLGTVAVDQQVDPTGSVDANGMPWLSIGTFTVSSGTLKVELSNDADGDVLADAVRLVPGTSGDLPTPPPPSTEAPPASSSIPIVIDDGGTGYSETAGDWEHFTGQGYEGTDDEAGSYSYSVGGDGSARADWTFSDVAPGQYTVAVTYPALGNRADNAPYSVYDGPAEVGVVAVNQQDTPDSYTDGEGNPWLVLGTFVADSGTLKVELSDLADGDVEADAVSIQLVPDARVSYTANYYDAADRLTSSVDVGDNGGFAYTRPDTPPTPSDTALVTSYGYNDAGWVSQETDPRGIVTATTYDTLGRPTQVVDDEDESVDAGLPTASANQTTDTTYDGLGDTLTVTAVMPSGTDNQTTTYAYGVSTSTGSGLDDNDLLASLTQPGVSNPGDSATTTYTYDALGDVLTSTDPNGTTHTYSYDVLGRQVSDAVTTLGTSVYGAVRRIDTAYDAQGQAYLFTSYDAVTGGDVVNQVEDTFNGLGQLTGEYQAVDGEVNLSTTPEVRYAYTEMSGGQDNSRLTSMTYPDGRVIDYVYDSGLDSDISRLSAIVDDADDTTLESYQYLGLDTIVAWDHPQTGVDLTYLDQPGDTSDNTDGGDEVTGLDRFGRVIDQNWVDTSTGTSNVRYQYGHDADGDVLYRADLVDAALSELYHANSTTSGDDATAYDALGRLTGFARGVLSASGNNGTTPDTIASPSSSQSWGYDALGNQVGVTTGGTAVTQGFNDLDQETSTSAGTAPTFDPDGNTLTDGSGLAYAYDAWNRLVAVKDASTDASVATYAYDGLGRRVEESYAGGSTNYLYYNSNWQVIEERQGGTSSSDVHYQYVYGNSGNLVLRDTVSDGAIVPADRLYAEWDANGDITAITDASGTVVERYEYSPYGQVTVLTASGTPVSGNVSAYGWQYLFQGGRQDAATGLYIFEHRDYNPTSGTWMERDPIGLAGGQEDLYAFVGDDPTEANDPSGLQQFMRWPGSIQILGPGIYSGGLFPPGRWYLQNGGTYYPPGTNPALPGGGIVANPPGAVQLQRTPPTQQPPARPTSPKAPPTGPKGPAPSSGVPVRGGGVLKGPIAKYPDGTTIKVCPVDHDGSPSFPTQGQTSPPPPASPFPPPGRPTFGFRSPEVIYQDYLDALRRPGITDDEARRQSGYTGPSQQEIEDDDYPF